VGKPHFISCIYSFPNAGDKHLTWQILRSLKPNDEDTWLCVGDFSEVLS